MSNLPVASIILCTRDRVSDLRQTLDSLAGVGTTADMPTELVVVDNGSTDGTAELARTFRLPQMTVQYVHEGRRGKGFAYNAGMKKAQGRFLLFTDDDVRFPSDWVGQMCAPLRAGGAEAVTGRVRMARHLERPWMEARHRSYLACDETPTGERPRVLVGASMGFVRDVLEAVPGFDPELGPGALGFNDETLFSFQLQEAGYRLAWAEGEPVEHHFDPSRLSRDSFYRRAVGEGRSRAYIAYHWEHGSWMGEPVVAPRRKIWDFMVQLLRWRARHWQEWHQTDGMTMWEMTLLDQIAFYRHYLQEVRRPRNYELRGRIKLHGLRD